MATQRRFGFILFLFCFQFRWIVELKCCVCVYFYASRIAFNKRSWSLVWIQQLSYASIDLIKCVIVSNFGNQIGAISFSLTQRMYIALQGKWWCTRTTRWVNLVWFRWFSILFLRLLLFSLLLILAIYFICLCFISDRFHTDFTFQLILMEQM